MINDINIYYYIFVIFVYNGILLMYGIYLFIYDVIKFWVVEIREVGVFFFCVKN